MVKSILARKNVRVKAREPLAQREKLPSPVLLASNCGDNTPPKEEKGTEIAFTRIEKYRHDDDWGIFLLAGGVLGNQTNNAAPIALDPSEFPEYPSPEQGFLTVFFPSKSRETPEC